MGLVESNRRGPPSCFNDCCYLLFNIVPRYLFFLSDLIFLLIHIATEKNLSVLAIDQCYLI